MRNSLGACKSGCSTPTQFYSRIYRSRRFFLRFTSPLRHCSGPFPYAPFPYPQSPHHSVSLALHSDSSTPFPFAPCFFRSGLPPLNAVSTPRFLCRLSLLSSPLLLTPNPLVPDALGSNPPCSPPPVAPLSSSSSSASHTRPSFLPPPLLPLYPYVTVYSSQSHSHGQLHLLICIFRPFWTILFKRHAP